MGESSTGPGWQSDSFLPAVGEQEYDTLTVFRSF